LEELMENESLTEMFTDSDETAENRPKRPKTPGSGRKAGTPNRATVVRRELIQVMTAASASPLEFLLAVMRSDSPCVDLKARIDAAKSLLPYLHYKAGEASAPGDQAKLVETAAQPPRQWTLADTARLGALREEERLGKLRHGSTQDQEFQNLQERWHETTAEGRAEAQREREEIGF
jgi:hypothetical protein